MLAVGLDRFPGAIQSTDLKAPREGRALREVTTLVHHSFTGVRTGAPLAFSSTTMNLAGSVLLALRPTT